MESNLTRAEFDDYMITLKSLLERIQEERYKVKIIQNIDTG